MPFMGATTHPSSLLMLDEGDCSREDHFGCGIGLPDGGGDPIEDGGTVSNGDPCNSDGWIGRMSNVQPAATRVELSADAASEAGRRLSHRRAARASRASQLPAYGKTGVKSCCRSCRVGHVGREKETLVIFVCVWIDRFSAL
jgi:hypothetical protein